jgi:hypothetical protein
MFPVSNTYQKKNLWHGKSGNVSLNGKWLEGGGRLMVFHETISPGRDSRKTTAATICCSPKIVFQISK